MMLTRPSSDLYDAFGARTSTASGSDVFGFGGQWGYYSDAETGLILCTHGISLPRIVV